ncbi:hypothetical protein [Methanoculleus chikugoensis]|uniref:hypothetical protein n=1 Tax=Methanoculleus chikugoensis TaxID=118126 RepID=UPI001FB3DB93|nr:hypothetical protein [Methanoculleus chikugoensis]
MPDTLDHGGDIATGGEAARGGEGGHALSPVYTSYEDGCNPPHPPSRPPASSPPAPP